MGKILGQQSQPVSALADGNQLPEKKQGEEQLSPCSEIPYSPNTFSIPKWALVAGSGLVLLLLIKN